MPHTRRRTPALRASPYDRGEGKPPKQPRKTRKDVCNICKTPIRSALIEQREDALTLYHQTKTVLWRSNPDDPLVGPKTHLCNACGLWRAERGRHKTDAELARSMAKKKNTQTPAVATASPDPSFSSDERVSVRAVATPKAPVRDGVKENSLAAPSSPVLQPIQKQESSPIPCTLEIDSRVVSSTSPASSAARDLSVEGPDTGSDEEDGPMEPDVIQGALSLLNLGRRMDPKDLMMIVNSTLGSRSQLAPTTRSIFLHILRSDPNPQLPQLPIHSQSSSIFARRANDRSVTYPDPFFKPQYSPGASFSPSVSAPRTDRDSRDSRLSAFGRVRGQDLVPRSLSRMPFHRSAASTGPISSDMPVSPASWSPVLGRDKRLMW
ncbi:hypothetical protein L202_05920 [Cryptococcus amylolentus CBS 6039]|uniref:GATA-type domain-containing protein n=1 Tax=Cryptococcus amylolentus CBS 6039 TaxID=1295533 RepID=A0A1E3HHW7_9TREE|nr:hypothetical protein L202_05920 [Cryptococcus amylolentus CBS 6039]ODN75939.1 hypothetical protein L202_05920 [Cryptococcus amylolentus CBS 6039]